MFLWSCYCPRQTAIESPHPLVTKHPVNTVKSFFVETEAGGLLVAQLDRGLQPMELREGRKISTKAFQEIRYFKSFCHAFLSPEKRKNEEMMTCLSTISSQDSHTPFKQKAIKQEKLWGSLSTGQHHTQQPIMRYLRLSADSHAQHAEEPEASSQLTSCCFYVLNNFFEFPHKQLTCSCCFVGCFLQLQAADGS